MGIYSDLILEQENKKAGQANSVTPRVTSQPKSPQPVQPVYTREKSILNPIKDATGVIANAGSNVAANLPQMAWGLGKDFVKGWTPLGLAHGIPALGRGLVAGAVDLVPSTVGLVGDLAIDAINSYNGNQALQHLPQERIRPMHTALEQWKEFQDTSNNLAIPVTQSQTPKKLASMGIKPVNGVSEYLAGNMATSDWGNLWQGVGEFAVPLGTINKAGAAIKTANNASKVAKLTPKVTQELSARVSPKAAAKYKEQIARMAEDRAKQEVANSIQAPGKFRKFAGDMAKFGAIGATEGESAEDKLTNALGAMGVGAIAHGVGAGVKKGWNSEKGLEFRKNAADNFKQATDSWDWISRATSGIDATLNTNFSKNANSITKARKAYLKLRMANPSIAKVISPESIEKLAIAGKLTPEEYIELFETAKYGSRERAYNLAKRLEQKLKENEAPKEAQEVKQVAEETVEKVEVDTDKLKEAIRTGDNNSLKNAIKTKENAEEVINKAVEQFNSAHKAIEEAGGINNANSTDILRKNDAKKIIKEVQKISNELPSEKESKNSSSSVDDLSHVKSETDINTPKQEETRLKNDSGMSKKNKTKKSNQSLKENQYIDEDGNVITRLESGEAEGAGDLYKLTAEKDENIYKNIDKDYPDNRAENMDEAHQNKLKRFQEKYNVIEDPKTNKYIIVNKSTGKPITPKQKKALREYFKEYKENSRELTQDERARAEIEESIEDDTYYDKYNDKSISEREVEENPVKKFKTDDAEFISWYDEYSKKTPKDKVKFLQKKLESFKNKEEQADFYNKFTEQGERESNSERAKNLGDEYYDTSNVDEVEHLTEASKGVNIKLERTPDEVQTEKNSANFQKSLDKAWNKNYRGGRLNIKGRLLAKRGEARQAEYNSIIEEIKNIKSSPRIRQEMIKDVNNIAKEINEAKKQFNEDIDTSATNSIDFYKDAIDELTKANKEGNLANGKAIIDSNNLKSKYLTEEGRKALQEHYTQSAEKANAKLAELGMEVRLDKNGSVVVNLNEQKAIKWAKDQSKLKNGYSQIKLHKDLRAIDKNPKIAIERAKDEARRILKANENIITNDILNAFENKQTSLKEVLGAKGTDKRWQYEETGDTWDRESSDVDEGQRKARQTVEGLKRASEDKDESYKTIGELGKKLSNAGQVRKYEQIKKYFANSKLGTIAKSIFNRHSEVGVCEVKKGTLADKSAYRNKSDEVFLEEGLSEEEKISLMAHELGHRDITQAVKTGKKAVTICTEIFGEEHTKVSTEELSKIKQDGINLGLKDEGLNNYINNSKKKLKTKKAVAKLREAVNNNIEANNKYSSEKQKLINKYGKDFVENTLDECMSLIEQGKSTNTLIKDKRKIWNKLKKLFPNNEIEEYCNKLQSEVLNEQRELGRRFSSEYKQLEQNETSNRKGKGIGSSEQSKGKMESSDRTSEGSVQEEGLEYSTRFGRMLNWFDKNKRKAPAFYETFKQPSSEKIKNLSDFYSSVSKSAEDLLLKYHRYTPERMKGRLFKQSKTGEGIYFLQGSEKSDRIVWKEDSGSSKYVKKLDGVKQKGTAEQAIARNLQRLAKMQHADACVNFLKEHFKEKKEGYVPVNSDLLFTGIVEGKSRAWLKTIMDGEESIRKTFDVNDAEEWTKLYKTTDGGNADIYLPKDILAETLTGEKEYALDYIKTYGKRGLDGKVRGYSKLAGAMLDFYNDRFKRLVLTSGSFVANNVFGNNIMLFANAESPADYVRSIADAFKLKDEQIPPEVLESTLAKSIMQEMQGGRKYFSEKDGTLNTIARLIDGDLIDIKANDLHGLKRAGAHLLNWGVARPNGVFRAISNAVGKVNDGFERFSRKQAYSIALRKLNKQKMIKTAASMKGIEALAEAAKDNKVLRQTVVDKVEDILGDYNNFTNIEKKFFKRVFPFYAWNRTITRHITHLAKDDPAMAFMVMYQTFRLLNQDDDLEDYQHGALKTGMYNNATKSNIVWNKANMIPYNTLFQMVTGEDHERIGTMTSAITKPLEAKRGKKFFLDQEITSKGYKKVSVDGKSGYFNTKTGEFKEGEAPWQVRAGYLGKDLVEKLYPMTGSPLTKSFKDKQYDASFGGYNHGDYIGKVKTNKGYKKKYRAAKNRLDTKYKIMNRLTGGWQPEHKISSKEQKEKYKRQRKKINRRNNSF